MNHELNYRRLMKPKVDIDGDLFWQYKHDSDDEGWVKQPSFMTPSYIATNQYGKPETAEEQTERQRHERLSGIVTETWHEMTGTGSSTDLKMIKDQRPIGYVGPGENRTVDSKMLEEKFVSLVEHAETAGIAIAAEDLLDIVLQGIPKPQIGTKRCLGTCALRR